MEPPGLSEAYFAPDGALVRRAGRGLATLTGMPCIMCQPQRAASGREIDIRADAVHPRSTLSPMPRRAAWLLGVSQLVCWGTTYYLVGGFEGEMAADLGRSETFVQAGFSLALLVMALASPVTGNLIDRLGGRAVMSAGSLLAAVGCLALAASHAPLPYFASWVVLGVAMRLTLYEAAFATLARIGGPHARLAMAQVTLLGGLASTVFWPLGHAMAGQVGWRAAVVVYAGFAASTVGLHAALPQDRYSGGVAARPPTAARHTARPGDALGAALYATTAMVLAFLNSGMSAHMIGILGGLGLGSAAAVSVASLRGVGQSTARLGDVLFGRRVHPFDLNLAATAAMPLAFVAAFWSGDLFAVAVVFAAVFGATNGLSTITRGTVPLLLFDVERYGAITGRLLAPSFAAAAAAPLGYAWVIELSGENAALVLSTVAAGVAAAAAFVLRLRYR